VLPSPNVHDHDVGVFKELSEKATVSPETVLPNETEGAVQVTDTVWQLVFEPQLFVEVKHTL